jgi:hypothetical protein
MPNERISMSKLKQVIGLQSSNLSVRALSRVLGLSVGAVSKYLGALRACGIEAGEAEKLSEVELEQRVFGDTGQAVHLGETGLCLDPRGAQTPPARDAAAAVGGIQRPAWGRGVSTERLLPDLPQLGEAAEALDAPAALCRREAVHRLRRAHGADLRVRRRCGVPGAFVYHRPGRKRLCLCRGHPHRDVAGLAREPRASVRILRLRAYHPRARQPEGRHHARRSLRAGSAAFV